MTSPVERDFVLLGRDDLQDYNEEGLLPQSQETLKKIYDWLQPTAYDDATSEYLKHLTSHVQGTGDWLPDTEEYKKWHDSYSHNILWVKAVPGAGKSVLAAHQRARLSMTEEVPILHFFFRQIVSTNRIPKQLVRDWITQLLPYSPSLQRRLKVVVLNSRQALDEVNFRDLWQMLQNAIKEIPRVYCFADALDEMSLGHDDFFDRLAELGQVVGCKVFLTSRPVPRIVEILRNKPLVRITLGPENMKSDIHFYVDHRLERDITRYIDHRLRNSEALSVTGDSITGIEDLIRSILKARAQGSFLYARLMMDNVLDEMRKLGRNATQENVRQVLSCLPMGLSQMYSSMLLEHSQRTGTSQEMQRIILQWVTHSEQPLRLLELAAIIDFQSGNLKRAKDTKAFVRAACGPLLEILPSDVVGPIHHSFTEYLTSAGESSAMSHENLTPRIQSSQAHRTIAEECIKYILHVYDDPANEDKSISQLKLGYPFLDYASRYWPLHASRCGSLAANLLNTLDSFVIERPKVRATWVKEVFPSSYLNRDYINHNRQAKSKKAGESKPLTKGNLEDHITPLHVAAFADLCWYIVHLVNLGHDPHTEDGAGFTATHVAASEGRTKSLEALMQFCRAPETSDGAVSTPLFLAASRNHAQAVKILLANRVYSTTPEGKTRLDMYFDAKLALDEAIEHGNSECVSVFLKNIDPTELAKVFRSAISWNRTEISLLIIKDSRLEVNRAFEGDTLLFTAANGRDIESMHALLLRGASVNKLSSFPSRSGTSNELRQELAGVGYTPLHGFVRGNYMYSSHTDEKQEKTLIRGLEMLLEAGCPIDAEDPSGDTALCNAKQNAAMASFLLKCGADPKAVTRRYPDFLHNIFKGHTEALQLWVRHGFDINSRDAKGETPLFGCVRSPRSDATLVKMLLEMGSNPKVSSKSGSTLLHVLKKRARQAPEITSLLIEAGVDVNARDRNGNTPLMLIDSLPKASALPVLLRAGADLDARNSSGETLILKVVRNSDASELIDHILTYSPDLGLRDSAGANALHLNCSSRPRTVVFDSLMDAGADPLAVDYHGNTMWHYLHSFSRSLKESIPDKLLELGVDPKQLNVRGQTPLHTSTAIDDETAVDFLLGARCGLDVNQADFQGITSLHFAATRSMALVSKLLEAGACVESASRTGQTALHYAALARKPANLSLLLQYGMDRVKDLVNAKDEEGRTALHYAARSGVVENVKMLLDAGALPDIPDRLHFTPLTACAKFPEEQISFGFAERNNPLDFRTCPVGKDWAAVCRELGATDLRQPFSSNPETLSIRQCVKQLIEAGAEVTGPPRLPNNLRINKGDINEAIDSGCEPMVEEILEIFEKQENSVELLSTHLAALDVSRRRLEIRHIKQKRFGKNLLAQDRIELIKYMPEVDQILTQPLSNIFTDERRGRIRDWHRDLGDPQNILQKLVLSGFYDVLSALRPVFGKISIPSQHSEFEFWPDNLVGRNKDTRGDPRFRRIENVFDQPLDGLLMMACVNTRPSFKTVKVIIEEYGCSAHEKTLALFHMAESQHLSQLTIVEYLIHNGTDVNAVNPFGETPLALTCSVFPPKNAVDTASCLLKLGANPNILAIDGDSCLNRAAANPSLFNLLLVRGANPRFGNPPALFKAIKSQDKDVVSAALKHGADVNVHCNRKDVYSWSPFHRFVPSDPRYYPLQCASAITGRFNNGSNDICDQITNVLLDQGADPFLITGDGTPILHRLLHQGSRTRAILNLHGLDLERRDEEGRTLLLSSARHHPDPHDGEDHTALKSLLGLGADLRATDNAGRNVLHTLLLSFSGESAYAKLADILTQKGHGDLVNSKDKTGHLPFHLALVRGSWKACTMLAEKGADLYILDPSGNNAFHIFFANKSSYDFKREAKRLKADIIASEKDVKDEWSFTRSHWSQVNSGIYQMATEFADYLFSKGIDVNALNEAGEPALFNLMRAVVTEDTRNYEMSRPQRPILPDAYSYDPRAWDHTVVQPDLLERVKDLTRKGMDVHVKSRGGQSALHALAARMSPKLNAQLKLHDESAARKTWSFLVEAGLDPYMEDNEGRSALDVAAACGSIAILEMY